MLNIEFDGFHVLNCFCLHSMCPLLLHFNLPVDLTLFELRFGEEGLGNTCPLLLHFTLQMDLTLFELRFGEEGLGNMCLLLLHFNFTNGFDTFFRVEIWGEGLGNGANVCKCSNIHRLGAIP
jgi:hypothetical protein